MLILLINTVDNDVGANHVSQVRRRQVVAAMTQLRGLGDRLQGIVNLVEVNQKLVLTPNFTGIAQDVDKILPCFR